MKDKRLIGIDIGGTTIKLAIINDIGEIIYQWEIATNTINFGNQIIADISKTIEQHLMKAGLNKENIKGIGVGAPGPINHHSGIVYEAVNIGWNNYPLKDLLELKTSLPVHIENDANCAALGEMWRGAGKGARDIICITLGTGIGGGIIVNGSIVHGKNGAGGEIGHITSVFENGVHCNCGKFGCLETIASATGIARLAKEALNRREQTSNYLSKRVERTDCITAKDVFETAKMGDPLSLNVIDQAAFYLGIALANLASSLNPEKIIISGGVSKAGDILLNPIKKYFQRFTFPRIAKSTVLTTAMLGNSAGVTGAAWLVHIK